ERLMRGFLIIVLVVVVVMLLGWVSFRSGEGEDAIILNKEKAQQDTAAAAEKVEEVVESASDTVENAVNGVEQPDSEREVPVQTVPPTPSEPGSSPEPLTTSP